MGHGLPEDGDWAAVTRAPSAQHRVSDTTLPIMWTWVDTGAAGRESTYPVCSPRMAVTLINQNLVTPSCIFSSWR